MCTNFTPWQLDKLLRALKMPFTLEQFPRETWPMFRAPMLRTAAEVEAMTVPNLVTLDRDQFRVDIGHFGLIPYWVKPEDLHKRRNTQNARSETIAELVSYKSAWQRCRFALIPMENFFEPYYGPERKNDRSVRWEIYRKDRQVFTVAAIWSEWTNRKTGEVLLSYSLITINADHHPIMKQFHRAGDEPRSLVVIPPEQRTAWVTQTDPLAARAFLREMPVDEFDSGPAPLPPRAAKPKAASQGIEDEGLTDE